jgi:hypothetical protein
LGATGAAPGTNTSWLAAGFVAVLAFLLASFPVRTSELWRHLAAGRAVAQTGNPFLAAADGTGWLFDLLLYAVYSAVGGPGLVVAKALLVGGLALVVWRLSRPGSGWWTATCCTTLSVLTVATRLPLQPVVVSYLFLALAVWEAGSEAEGATSAARRLRSKWLPPLPLVALFGLWVNLDSWFLLGLAIVGLMWLGQALDGMSTVGPRALWQRGVALALLAAACLINPAHAGAFTWPPELAWSAPVTSPFGAPYWAVVWQNPVGLTYFLLLFLSGISFLFNLPRWPWARFLPWLALAVLSVLHMRAVPFFAVVAGPVLARNLYDYWARHPFAERGRGWLTREDLRALRPLGVAAGVLLLVAAWPGWLQDPRYYGPRRWAAETPPSPEAAAVQARHWRQEGKFGPESRGLHLSTDTLNAFAWLCPEVPGVYDEQLAAPLLKLATPDEAWFERMQAAGIDHVIVHHPDQRWLFFALETPANNSAYWPLMFVAGDVAVFGFRDPARPDAARLFRGQEMHLDHAAFHPEAGGRAPLAGPDRDPTLPYFWEAFWKPAMRPTVDSDAAKLFTLYAEAVRRKAGWRHLVGWQATELAGLVGAGGGWTAPGGMADAFLRAELYQPGQGKMTPLDKQVLVLRSGYVLLRDDTPPALLYLAIRAARRALADDPDDAASLAVLGQAYQRLLRETSERVWAKRLPELHELRRAQASWALNQAVALRPDNIEFRLYLGTFYHELGYLDLALEHYRSHQKLLLKSGQPPGVPADKFRAQSEALEQKLSRLAAEVEDRESVYAAEAEKLRLQDRARKALDKGLAGKALELLREVDVSAFGKEGLALELELLLRTGRARDVRDWTDPQHREMLGEDYYHWVRAQALAALGDYARAEDELASTVTGGAKGSGSPRALLALVVSQAVLDQQPGSVSLPRLAWQARRRLDFNKRAEELVVSMRQLADWSTLRGLIALEQGDDAEATAALRSALSFWKAPEATSGGGIDFAGRPLAVEVLHRLER